MCFIESSCKTQVENDSLYIEGFVNSLLQIDDATSSSVQIQFHTVSPSTGDPTKPNLSAKCEKVTFRNNGIAFRPEDWARLKRIAEGNPGKWIIISQ